MAAPSLKKPSDQAVTPTEASAWILHESQQRLAFYRRVATRSVAVLIASVLGNLVLGVLAFVLWQYVPDPQVLALDRENRLVPLQPLEEPVYSRADITAYVDRALHFAHDYSFADYVWRNEEACNRYFTPDGCTAYREAIDRNLRTLRDARLTSKVTIEKPPVIVAQGLYYGRWAWDVQVGIRLTFESATQRTAQQETVTLRVVRLHELQDTQGLGIHKYLSS